jgi:hypothetical protein
MKTTERAEIKEFGRPDEVRTFGHGKLELVNFGEGVVGKITLQPGWRWSKDVKPIAGTKWCEAPHFQFQVSGRIHVLMEDGTEFESGPGTVLRVPPGHDAWVVGDEPVVAIDWHGATEYAKTALKKAA